MSHGGQGVPGYRGIWYSNQEQDDAYRFKYSGGFATYPQQVSPIAVHVPEVARTYFCFGGANESGEIENLIAYYDHITAQVSRPRRVLARMTSDAHYNSTLAIDEAGHIYVFCNAHGRGGEQPDHDPTYGKAYVFRSRERFSIDTFELVHEDNFSYSQVWPRSDGRLMWLHTRYAGGPADERRLHWATWHESRYAEAPSDFAAIGIGDYQVSGVTGDTVWTAFDHHPNPGGFNARTNIYVAQHHPDHGWRDGHQRPLGLPLTDVVNPALVRDYVRDGRLVYLKDFAFDANAEPHLLYLLSAGPWSGPQSVPRSWHILYRRNGEWIDKQVAESSHNYDHGFLDIASDGTWRLLAPLESGPQAHGTGGRVVLRESTDEGQTWRTVARYPVLHGRNQTYVRKVVNAHPDFWALWADGNAYEPSASSLYFGDRSGRMYRLPWEMDGDFSAVEQVR